ncbi:hypothetical protein BDF21DRAFT_349726, partial [Thamnidium elegans]
HRFCKNSIYCDVKANPGDQFNASFCLAQIYIHINVPLFACFLLRTSWIPSYITIDSKLLYQNIMGRSWTTVERDKPAM